MATVSDRGDSGASRASEKRHEKIWEEFVDARTDVDLPKWDACSEAQLCSWALIRKFAGYLTQEYIILDGRRNSGQHYGPGSAANAVGRAINRAYRKFHEHGQFGGSGWAHMFGLLCLKYVRTGGD